MDDAWYYADNSNQKGPVSGRDLLALERSGLLRAESLVWKAGLPQWQKWSAVVAEVRARVGESGDDGGGEGAKVAVCAYSGRVRPISEMVAYGDRWVSLEHKDLFLQSLREGVPVARLAGVGEFQYVGFWWRVLAMIVDILVLMIPNLVVAAPYYYLLIRQMVEKRPSPSMDPLNQFKTMDAPMVVAYVFMTVGSLLIPLVYDTWMQVRYGGTVGKLAVGARVAKPGGERLTYRQSLGRAGAKLLNMLIWVLPATVAFVVGSLMSFGSGTTTQMPKDVPVAMLVGVFVMMAWYVVGGFGYYMAGWTRKKQSLHDLMARTVVIKRNPQ